MLAGTEVQHQPDTMLFNEIPEAMDFYFVHSFAFDAEQPEDVIAETDYGVPVTAALTKGACIRYAVPAGEEFESGPPEPAELSRIHSIATWRRVGPVLPAIQVYNSREVDELILVDITASVQGDVSGDDSVSDFADECAVPFTVGGGITELGQIAAILRAGADKVAVNSVLFENSTLLEEAARRFGAQCMVASVDPIRETDGSLVCTSHSGTRKRNRNSVEWARELADCRASEILLTSVDRDRTMLGYDIELTAAVANPITVPVIASGGAGNYQHMIDVIRDGGAAAVATASIFHFTEQTPSGEKAAMRAAGITVRAVFIAPAPA
jgi:cyclase